MRRSDEFQPADLKGISMIPFGLLAGFMDEKEIRITELAEEDFGFDCRRRQSDRNPFTYVSMIWRDQLMKKYVCRIIN